MNQFLNQFWKDFRQTAINPVFFLVLGLCTTIWSFVFIRQLFEFARRAGSSSFAQGTQQGYSIHEAVFMSHISITHLLLVFVVPILTMRLVAEEKKLGTFDLLMTAPVASTTIVLGKFFAAYCAILSVIAVSFLYPFVISWFAEFNMSLLLCSYLGLAFAMAVYTAIGLFSSSMTRSIVLSAFVGVALTISLFVLSSNFSQISDSDLATYLAFSGHFEKFFLGNLVSSSVVYFLVLTAFFIFLSQRMFEFARGGEFK